MVSLIILALIVFWCIRKVNDFKKKEIRVQEGIPGVEVALTKSFDMLAKMLDTAKGYMTHESELFKKVIELRHGMSVVEMNDAQQQMDVLSGRFFAVAENYPALRSSEFSQSFSGGSTTRKNICRRRGGCITATSSPTIRRSPCSRQKFWQLAPAEGNLRRRRRQTRRCKTTF